MIALGLLGAFALLWFRHHPHMPWRDALPLLRDLQPLLDGDWSSEHVWQQIQPHYTAHRVLILRALLFLDIQFLSGSGHLLYFTGWLSLLSILGLYSYGAQRHMGQNSSLLIFSIAIAISLLCMPSHLWNFINPVCAGWLLSFALSVTAFWLLLKQPGQATAGNLALAYTLILIAAFVVFSGVLAWLVVPGLLLLRRHPAWPVAALLSLAFVSLYTIGISSDAKIALQMLESIDPNKSEVYSLELQAAIDANTAGSVFLKSLDLIGWPLSSSQLVLARLMALGSLAVLIYTAINAGRRWHHRETELPLWTLWCAIAALFCLGNIFTVSLGRVLEYQDLLHGPSPERHQTMVVLYWLFIAGTVCGWLNDLRQSSQVFGMTALGLLSLALVFLPSRDILKNEFISTEFAGYLFLVGEQPELRAPPQKLGLQLTPHYPLAFDEWFDHRDIAYHAPLHFPEAKTLSSCTDQFEPEIGRTNPLLLTALQVEPPFAEIQFNWHGHRSLLSREIVLTREGNIVGRLVPSHQGDYSWLRMLDPQINQWRGGVLDANAMQGTQMWSLGLFGWTLQCMF
jgi:hypothetical protein